ALDVERLEPLRYENPRFDGRAGCDDRRPAAVLEAPLGSQLRADLTEHLGLQLRQVRNRAAHTARRMVLGESIRRHHEGKRVRAHIVAAGLGRIGWMTELLARGIGPLLVERVLEWRLVGLVMGG